MIRQRYDTDLQASEMLLLEPLIPAAKPGGRPRDTDMCEVVNAIFYIVRSAPRGYPAWRLLPHDFLPWQTVYGYFAAWRRDGTWQRINDALREAVREQETHEAAATAGSFDSQSVKTMNADANGRGFDGAKLVTGRKRFILVDTLGWLLQVVVTSAKTPERNGAEMLFCQTPDEILAHLELVWADGGFAGVDFATWLETHFGILVEIVKRPETAKGFVLLPRRWVVAPNGYPTFGWLGYFRRLSKDYERTAASSVAFIYTAMIRLMLQRLTHSPLLYL